MFPLRAALLLVLVWAAGACSNSEAPPAKSGSDSETAQPAGPQVDWSGWEDRGPAAMFLRARLAITADERLPQTIEDKDWLRARRLCDASRLQVKQLQSKLGDSPPDADTAALFDNLKRRCGDDVAEAILDDLIVQLDGTPTDQLDSRCTSAQREMVFSMEHRTTNADVIAKRDAVFKRCPELEAQWKAFEAGSPPQ